MLAKTVSTAGNISAGALLALKDPATSPAPVPPIVADLIALVAETLCVAARPDDATVADASAHLASLIVRYGTMKRALEALASGGRRHPAISHEKAAAWNAIMETSVAQIESAFRRSPSLSLSATKWISAQGETLEARLDAYTAWLAGEVRVDDWTPTPRASEPSLPTLQPSPSTEEPGDAAQELLRLFSDRKRLLDPPTPPLRLSEDHRRMAERLFVGADHHPRTVAAIALGRFSDADALLPALRSSMNEADFWRLWGDRYYYEGRFDDAAEAYRAARTAGDDVSARRDLACALLRSTRPPIDVHIKEAVDLLSETLRTMPADAPDRPFVQALLGTAWIRHPGADRDVDLRRAIEHLESAIAGMDPSASPEWWAEAHAELGSAWLSLPSGRKLENVQRAITCFERCAQVWQRESDPDRWAAVQNHLGQAWERLPAGDRALNLRRAIECFNAALEVKSRDADPIGWAMLQNNLGIAWVQVVPEGEGDATENIRRAIDCHQNALEVWSAHNRRTDWAATQNNLGNALALLPASDEERERNLRRAMAAYKAALEVRTRAAYPVEWASTQNNLGSALLHLPPEPDGSNIKEAITCFERALEVRTRDALPVDWARTQANMGNAWMKMPGDRASNLRRAVECYNQALSVLTRASHPHQHQHIAQKKAEAMDILDELQIMGRG